MNGQVGLDGAWKIKWCDDNHGRPEQYVGLDAITVYPELADDHGSARLHCRLFAENVTDADLPATVRAACPQTGSVVEKEVTLPPGIDYRVPWPADQPLPEIVRMGNLA
jgi:hypothetical protein